MAMLTRQRSIDRDYGFYIFIVPNKKYYITRAGTPLRLASFERLFLQELAMTKASGFIGRHGLWTDEQQAAAADVVGVLDEGKLRCFRVSVSDPQGKLRSKTLMPGPFRSALSNGVEFTNAQYGFDSAEGIAYNPFIDGGGFAMAEMAGFANVILVPDPLTFRQLPWAPGTGWVQGDLYFRDGRPVPFDARHRLKAALAELEREKYAFMTGLEIEFYVAKVLNAKLAPEDMGGLGQPPTPPVVEAAARGYSYQVEDNLDRVDDLLSALADYCVALKLPLRTMENEMGPGQLEFTFDVQPALQTADTTSLFRSMVKQVATRRGFHATFMTRPGLPNYVASGWHLHQSLATPEGKNAFASEQDPPELLSEVGRYFVGGLLEHAAAASVFTTPTVNGYRRRKPNSLAPDRATWGYDNRAAMIRVHGTPGDASCHIENRIGEPGANPYLYIASQALSGLDGLRRRIDPGAPETSPYAATHRPLLPTTLMEALDALNTSKFFRQQMSDKFVDWLIGMKQSEVNRFLAAEPQWQKKPDEVTAWEHREYFTRY
jgi:glutamine synthetase